MSNTTATLGANHIDTGCPVCGNNGCPDCGEPDRSTMYDRTTTATLAQARTDIHAAVAAHDDPDRRRQYAQSARDNATTVVLAGDATDDELRHAHYYLDDAAGILATT
ncbi:hypothetical protein VXE65_02675 [Mycolicibacterium conceptionense]|uniref:hypothetical protein n=1 Tax=Mycolicibacterium conceptionense TaxID=451644 RepID=UPI003204EECA